MAVLEFEKIGGTVVLTMNRPAQRNALDYEMREAFARAVSQVRDDAGVRAVVLTGAGGNFCAGADVGVLASQQAGRRDIHEGRERIRKIHRWFDELVDLEKPVIAAVDGVAFGAGLSLALCADVVFASASARFCCVFARLGYVPDMGAMYLLPRVVGLARAKDMAFTARVVDAREALQIGLAQHLRETGVLEAALAYASHFSTAPTATLGMTKGIMNRAFESDRRSVYAQEAMAQAMCRESDFHAEAVRRFMAKEAPLYEWPKTF